MKKSKYEKDASGNNILGTQHGITITRPWSNEMYEHNDKVAEIMKEQIIKVVNDIYAKEDYDKMKIIASSINGYRYGTSMSLNDVYEDTLRGCERLQNHWIHSDTWPELLKAGLVEPLNTGFVGYDKL